MAVRTKRLADGLIGIAVGGYYTVPADKTAIIKQITYNNPSTGATTTISIFIVTPTSTKAIVRDVGVVAGTVFRSGPLFIVLEPGDSITAVLSVASAVGMTVSGAELDGVAL